MKKYILLIPLLLMQWINAQNCRPVLHYNFQNNLTNSGSQGASLNAVVSQAITYGVGKDGSPNSAAVFNGMGSKFEIPSTLDFPQRTWALWVNASLIDTEYRIVFDADNSGLLNAQTQLFVNKENGIDYMVYAIGSNSFKIKINPNEWNHVALVRSTSDVKFYFNGCLIFTGNKMDNAHSVDGNLNKINVGTNRNNLCQNKNDGSNGNCFQGSIDDLRVYDCALDALMIKRIAGTSCPGDCSCGKWNSMQYQLMKKGTGDSFEKPLNLACGKTLVVGLGTKVQLKPSFTCEGSCKATFKAELVGPTGTKISIDQFPYTFSASAVGDYTLTVTPTCGESTCQPCVVHYYVTPGCSGDVLDSRY